EQLWSRFNSGKESQRWWYWAVYETLQRRLRWLGSADLPILDDYRALLVAIGGATQNHWSDFSSLSVEFQRSRPNLILGVPRVFEKVRNSAAQKAADG